MKRILFQGDSITDAGRSRESDDWRGNGYATLVSASLGYEYINEFECINRGISGNRVIDLLARVKSDIINLEPDYMSIMIGVNDVWHELSYKNGIDAEQFEEYYNMLINQVKTALPGIKIMILEPYVIKGSATIENWQEFRHEVELRAEAAKRVAEKNKLPFVPLMKAFDEMVEKVPSGYLSEDGVHPTAVGHELIKREWLKMFNTIK